MAELCRRSGNIRSHIREAEFVAREYSKLVGDAQRRNEIRFVFLADTISSYCCSGVFNFFFIKIETSVVVVVFVPQQSSYIYANCRWQVVEFKRFNLFIITPFRLCPS